MRRSTIARIGSASSFIFRPPKYGATVERKRVWCGGSMVNIVDTDGYPVAMTSFIFSTSSGSGRMPVVLKFDENVSTSRMIGTMSS